MRGVRYGRFFGLGMGKPRYFGENDALIVQQNPLKQDTECFENTRYKKDFRIFEKFGSLDIRLKIM